MIYKTRQFNRWARKALLPDALRMLAKDLLGLTNRQLLEAVSDGTLMEVNNGTKK